MKFLYILLLFIWPAFVHAQNKDSAYSAYIEKYSPLAMAEQQRSGVPASIKLAQGLLESGAGTGDLCLRSNNHFGIKCKNTWTGDKVYHDDDARGECFRAYGSVEESYIDHSNFLKNNGRYASLFLLDVNDYKAWAEGLKKAGYATNPKYVALLIKVIEENNLNSFTLLASQTTGNAPAAVAQMTVQTPQQPTATVYANPSPAATSMSPIPENTPVATVYPEGLFYINQTKVLFAKAGSSVLALATSHNISLSEILAFNDMSRTEILDKDQLIFVERKKKRGETALYEAREKETLWSISQKHGIRLAQLAFWNKLNMQAQVQRGTLVYLQEPPAGKITSVR